MLILFESFNCRADREANKLLCIFNLILFTVNKNKGSVFYNHFSVMWKKTTMIFFWSKIKIVIRLRLRERLHV